MGASLQDVFASFARFGIHGAKTPTAAATPGSAGGKPVSKGGGVRVHVSRETDELLHL